VTNFRKKRVKPVLRNTPHMVYVAIDCDKDRQLHNSMLLKLQQNYAQYTAKAQCAISEIKDVYARESVRTLSSCRNTSTHT